MKMSTKKMTKVRTISPGNKSMNELKHMSNKPAGTGSSGGKSMGGGTANEMKMPSSRPSGPGYGSR